MGFPNFSPKKVRSRGPENAQVLIVGEAPGEKEDERLQAFIGTSGQELDRQLSEARFVTSSCRFTNAIRYRPYDNDISLAFVRSKRAAVEAGLTSQTMGRWALPVATEGLKELRAEIASVQPRVIIAAGGTALWATTGKEGIEDWRGSELDCVLAPGTPVIPTYHPSAILRQWSNRHIAVHDLRHANRVLNFGPTPPPPWNFILRPSYQQVWDALDQAEAAGDLAVDIETKKLHIACVGIAWTRNDAICIPFLRRDGSPYWAEEEEVAIVMRLQRILTTHRIIGQNFHYDAQYFARRMLVIPNISFDTMLAQHVLFPGTDKSLAFLSSIYCPYHVFWKDDGKEWDPAIHPEEQLWRYNCVDCVKTFEVMESQKALLKKYNLVPQMEDYMMRLWPHVLQIMLRGVRVDPARKQMAGSELGQAIEARQHWLNTVVGRPFNPKSSKQMIEFLCEELGVKGRKGKKTKGKVSFDKKNLAKVGDEHILLWPFVQCIEEIRSLGVFKSTFAEAELDEDGRMRCSFNMGGAETFRFSSSENAFYTGTNLQNIPKGDRSVTMDMPNMRGLFIPDEEMEIAEVDLAGADAQVVAWEADDAKLKAAFRSGVKIHTVNAKDLFGANAGPDGKREPYYTWAKQGVHLTNYLGTAPTLAKTLGITVHEAEKFQKRWFEIHPEIPRNFHARVIASLHSDKSVRNRFGFRRVYFDRIESVYSEAVAWIPQSTVAIVINKAFMRIGEEPDLPVEVLLQVHDSLVFQYPKRLREQVLARLYPLLLIPVPYDDPLTINLGLKVSDKSWGDIEDLGWHRAEA